MKLSPILGLPIAEPDDFATNYPVEVDDPRTLAIEEHLNRPVAAIWYDLGSVAAGVSDLKGGIPILSVDGITYDASTGVFTLPKDGVYLFVCTVGLATNTTCQALLYQNGGLVAEGSSAPAMTFPRSVLAGGVNRAAGSAMKFSVSAGAASDTNVATASISLL